MRGLLHHAPAAFDRPNPESSLSATGPIATAILARGPFAKCPVFAMNLPLNPSRGNDRFVPKRGDRSRLGRRRRTNGRGKFNESLPAIIEHP